jgi:bifunctional DNA-binding transcriptional regulator/antitoxin component of YhaV-PrlF toxin-antitoxin module
MTITVRTKTPLVVPDQIRRRAGFKSGDQLEFKVSAGVVTILPKPNVAREPDDILTPAEAKRLRRSLKQTKEGKTRPWSQIKHELGL